MTCDSECYMLHVTSDSQGLRESIFPMIHRFIFVKSVTKMLPGINPWEISSIQSYWRGSKLCTKCNTFGLAPGNDDIGADGDFDTVKVLLAKIKHLLKSISIRTE